MKIVSILLFIFAAFVLYDSLGEVFPKLHQLKFLHGYGETYIAGAKMVKFTDAFKNFGLETLEKLVLVLAVMRKKH